MEPTLDEAKERIIVALDVDNVRDAKAIIRKLAGQVGYFKIGLELILVLLFGAGWKRFKKFFDEIRTRCKAGGFIPPGIMFDIKLHDIPNTMKRAIKQISMQNVQFVTIHASAGDEAMADVADNKGETKILAVTVLTSLDEEEANTRYGGPSKAKVVAFAKDAKLAGVDAIVCSPKETSFIRKKRKLDSLNLFNPGIRPEWAKKNDQQRVTTPKQAILNGADFVVIGRPITQPPKGIVNSRDAVERIAEEILEALVEKEKKEK